jgi:diaminopimelate epimerase
LNGGDLEIDWDEASGEINMTGPAAFVFDGWMEV